MPQFGSYPLITSVNTNDKLMVHQASSGAEKLITTQDFADTLSNIDIQLTIADLRAKDVTNLFDGSKAVVGGYYTIGDGGGGDFYYDSSSALIDNGGTIIAPNSGIGRWLRPTSRTFNVKQFGALGNALHDDTNNIQEAVDAAKVAVTSCVFFPAGVYRIFHQIVMTSTPNCNISFEGEGQNVSIIQQNGAGENGLNLSFQNFSAFQPYRATIQNIGFRTVGPCGTAIIISYGSPPFTVNHNNITALIDSVAVESDNGSNYWDNGIDIENAGNTHISNCYISGNTHGQIWTNLSGDGIRMRRYCVNSHFSNVQVSYFLNAFHWTSEGGGNTEGLFFSNCSFAQVRKAVYIEGNGAAVVPRMSLITWQGGLVELRSGIAAFDLVHCENVHIKNTMIIEGVPVSPYYGIRGSYLADATIEGVEFFAMETGVAVLDTSRAINVKNCVFRGGTTQVAFSSGTTDSRSGGHVLYDATPLETNANASNRIYNNSGYYALVRRSATQSIPDNTEDTISWQTAVHDDLDMYDAGFPLVLSIPAGVTHIKVTLGVRWQVSTSGARIIRIKTNDGTNWACSETTGNGSTIGGGDSCTTTGIIPVYGLTTVEASILQASGGAINVRNVEGTFMTVEVVG